MTLSKARWFRDEGLILLALAILISLCCDTPVLFYSPLSMDEHVSWWIVSPDNPGTLLSRSLDYSATPPISSLLQRIGVSVFDNDVGLRLPSEIVSVLAMILVYMVGVQLGGGWMGGLAALLLALHPDVREYSRMARPYALLLLTGALLLFFSVRWIQSGRWTALLGVMFAAATCIWTHYLATPWVVAVIVWLFFCKGRDQRSIIELMAVCVMIAIACLPLAAPVFRLMEWAPEMSFRTESSWSDLLTSWWTIAVPVSVTFAVLLHFSQRDRKLVDWTWGWSLLWLSVSVVMAAIFANVLGNSTLLEPRYRIVTAPVTALFVSWILTRIPAWRSTNLLTVVLIVTAMWGIRHQKPWESGQHSLADDRWESVGKELSRRVKEGDVVMVYSGLVEQRILPYFFEDPMWHDYVCSRIESPEYHVEGRHIGLPFFMPESGDLPAYYNSLFRTLPMRVSIHCAIATDTDLGQNCRAALSQMAVSNGWKETWNDSSSVVTGLTWQR